MWHMVQVEVGKIFEFVLNFRSAQRGAALPLLCPGAVCAIYKRQFGTAVLKPGQLPCEPYMPLPHMVTLASLAGLGVIGKTCDLVAGSYRFSTPWSDADHPLRVRLRVTEGHTVTT